MLKYLFFHAFTQINNVRNLYIFHLIIKRTRRNQMYYDPDVLFG